MSKLYNAALTQPDIAVWKNLQYRRNANEQHCDIVQHSDQQTIQLLDSLNNPKHDGFRPSIVTTWDRSDISPELLRYLVDPYYEWAKTIVRRPTDVVFLTHILLYLSTSVPSAIYLFAHFTWTHAILHWAMTVWYSGAFTLMLHNHIHNNGILSKDYAYFDKIWPYLLEPLMGHTWDSYYYHHVKHHHVENNGPGDLSSTIRCQRDSVRDFACYVARFLFFVSIELPIRFVQKKKYSLALRVALSELSSFTFICILARYNFRAAFFTVILPLVQMRSMMMVGNWGQHALVDEVDPDSDYRSSITLIDVSSNRHCFNDGYHTSHHLNPRRHWRDHPLAFIKGKSEYTKGRALTFHNIDYIMLTITLLRKDYMHLASCLIPMGEQIGMTQVEIAEMLRRKTRRFSEEEIMKKYGKVS